MPRRRVGPWTSRRRELKIILEADSYEWHGGRAALAKDARRYNMFVVHSWLVLRFAWEDVMFDPDYVREVIAAVVVALRLGQSATTITKTTSAARLLR